MLQLSLLVFLLVSLIAARLNANEFSFIEKNADVTVSLLSASPRTASLRLETNNEIPRLLRLPFLKKTFGYAALTQFGTVTPRGIDPVSPTGYQCELQLRTVRTVSSRFLCFLLTGNTVNLGGSSAISGDIGGGLRYALGSRAHLALTAICSLYYPDGVVATVEPGIVWNGLSLSCRTANAFPPNGRMPGGNTFLAAGYRLSF